MLRSLLEKLRGGAAENTPGRTRQVQLAAATLLIEVAWADHDISGEELAVVRSALIGQFDLEEQEVEEIIRESRKKQDESVGLHTFTRTLVEAWDEQQRFDLLVALWRLAYSDTGLHRFEEHTIRKISDLLYVSHSRFIESKRVARDAGV